ncbi:MAG: hypothetical protein KGI25_04580 [Thaumarchaeota archaeon]|nr:hypothetical protein [Nitrososphaerota archaeon]
MIIKNKICQVITNSAGGFMRKVNLHSAFGITMNTFNLGDMVRIAESERDFGKVYIIKEIKKVRRGGRLYLLKSLDDDVLRLYYEDKKSLLEKIA